MILNNPRCPNCGSTAQVKHLIGGAFLCGCGQMFYVVQEETQAESEVNHEQF